MIGNLLALSAPFFIICFHLVVFLSLGFTGLILYCCFWMKTAASYHKAKPCNLLVHHMVLFQQGKVQFTYGFKGILFEHCKLKFNVTGDASFTFGSRFGSAVLKLKQSLSLSLLVCSLCIRRRHIGGSAAQMKSYKRWDSK